MNRLSDWLYRLNERQFAAVLAALIVAALLLFLAALLPVGLALVWLVSWGATLPGPVLIALGVVAGLMGLWVVFYLAVREALRDALRQARTPARTQQ